MRATYGTDFAITNSGGIRADLTCPTTDNPDDFCPAYTPPPFPITRGSVLGVLPFGNVSVTGTVSGAEIDAFLADESSDAYERLVDRLLASPHYGQRWARKWLDLARYADTNGYEKDRGRTIWPYRDWVINALNSDMPFDVFVKAQIAAVHMPRARMGVRGSGPNQNHVLGAPVATLVFLIPSQ